MQHLPTDHDVFYATKDREGDIHFTKVVPAEDRPLTPFAVLRFVHIDGDTFQLHTSFHQCRGRADVAAVKYVRFEQ